MNDISGRIIKAGPVYPIYLFLSKIALKRVSQSAFAVNISTRIIKFHDNNSMWIIFQE